MVLRFVVFFAVLLVLLGLVNAYVHRRVSRAFGLGATGRRRFAAVLALGLVAMVVTRMLGPAGRTAVLAVGGLGATIQVGALVAFGVLAVDGILRGVGQLAERLRKRDVVPEVVESPVEASSDVEPHLVTRRNYLERATAAGALALGGGSAFYGSVFGRTDYGIEEVPIRLEKLPRALEGFTITQLSDLHIGLFVGDPEMESAIALVAKTKPDIITLTGDLLDNDVAFAPQLARFVRRLGEIAPVYAIPGNHDHYAGVRATLRHLREGGAHVLFNSHARVAEGQIVLAGVDDVWGRRRGRGPDLKQALYGAGDGPRILLCHNPVFFPEASPEVDLQLSGHTHGGQFNPGVRPADLVLPFGYVAGRYTRDGSQLYVNRGFGTAGPPARLGSPPEITKLVLTS